MSLTERLEATRQPIQNKVHLRRPVEEPESTQSAAMTQLKTAAIARLLESVGSRLTDSSITDDQLRQDRPRRAVGDHRRRTGAADRR